MTMNRVSSSPRPPVRQSAAAIVLVLCGLLAASGSHADERGRARGDRTFRTHEFRERDFRDQRYLDFRHHHDRYYPPVGFVFGALPMNYVSINFAGSRFYFAGGIWYRSYYGPNRFVVVAPPLGVIIPVLPPFYSTVWVGGVPYYYANSVYYVQTPQGYMVVAPPAGTIVEQPPAGAYPPYVEQPQQPAAPPPSATAPPPPPPSGAARVFAYPQRGQSAEVQAKDRQDCHEWAVQQSGFDPGRTSANAGTSAQSDDYRRAIGACLETRGYTVR